VRTSTEQPPRPLQLPPDGGFRDGSVAPPRLSPQSFFNGGQRVRHDSLCEQSVRVDTARETAPLVWIEERLAMKNDAVIDTLTRLS
jgi:hypothetical protein